MRHNVIGEPGEEDDGKKITFDKAVKAVQARFPRFEIWPLLCATCGHNIIDFLPIGWNETTDFINYWDHERIDNLILYRIKKHRKDCKMDTVTVQDWNDHVAGEAPAPFLPPFEETYVHVDTINPELPKFAIGTWVINTGTGKIFQVTDQNRETVLTDFMNNSNPIPYS